MIDPASYYFRIAPLFETEAPQYAWLNNLIATGIGHRFAEGPMYSLFEVLGKNLIRIAFGDVRFPQSIRC